MSNELIIQFKYNDDWVLHPSHRVAYMDKIISESADAGAVICESAGVFTPYYANSSIQFIQDASTNFKLVSEQFEIGNDSSKILLAEDSSKIYVQNDEDIIAIKLEDHLISEIGNYMLKFK